MKRVLFTLGLVVSILVLGRVWNALEADAVDGGGGGLPAIICPPGTLNGDTDGNGELDLNDPVLVLNYLFLGGREPCAIAGAPPSSLESLRLVDPDGNPGTLLFGPTDDCTIRVDPQGPMGLLLTDPKGVRVLTPNPAMPPRLLFGPTDDCSIGIDPVLPGLIERDPIGFRLLGPNNQCCRLIFGPTLDCTIEVNPAGPGGLTLRDPRCIRVLNPDRGPAKIVFGPTDDCSIGIDPAFPGLVERDPTGFRLLGRNNQGCRLIFGPTLDCTIEVNPEMPPGLLLRDPRGIRILPPFDMPGTEQAPRILFGPTDDCSIGIDPQFMGLLLRDPKGIRFMSPDVEGPARLLFGPTDDCTIGIDPRLRGGIILRDPRGVRLMSPDPAGAGPARLLFGPTDDCSIGVNPDPAQQRPGLRFMDPRGFFFDGPFVQAQQFIETSSRRFKERVRPIAKPLETLRKLQGVSFQWKDELGGKEDLGFIAEDVAEVLPQVVTQDPAGDGSAGLSYGHLVAVTVEGIKEQQDQLEAVERENAALRKELASVQDQLRDLASRVAALTPGDK